MSNGRNIAIASHIVGVVLAGIIAYLVSPYLAGLLSVQAPPIRVVLIVLVLAWGIYKLIQILRGRDELARKAEDHFDKGK